MVWRIEILEPALKDIRKLDRQDANRILKFLHGRLAKLENPRAIGEALHGESLGEFWKYRIGDYRVIAKIEDDKLVIVVVRVWHRREVYR